eukprot:TRINITY_DN4249_c0_g4_i1.p1 TRINITY_DN4249_c0_g4~~TRINITY_DN4249_c0_g4_i1.p1  ORF type:complete len:304 (+),score=41.29 TRINITY_DN4249_c0_g4_i1:34-912(+)
MRTWLSGIRGSLSQLRLGMGSSLGRRNVHAAAAPSTTTSEDIPGLQQVWESMSRFRDCPPSAVEMDEIGHVLNNIKFSDLRINTISPSQLKEIGCMTLVNTPHYNICFFFIPPGKSLALHDHPGMEIAQKVICGQILVEGYDWVVPRNYTGKGRSEVAEAGLAFNVYQQIVTTDSDVVRIRPHEGGILHEIQAVGNEVAGFVDIVTPPYNPPNIDCTFFSASPPLQASTVADCPMPPSVLASLPPHFRNNLPDLISNSEHPIHILTPRPDFFGPSMTSFRPLRFPWMQGPEP